MNSTMSTSAATLDASEMTWNPTRLAGMVGGSIAAYAALQFVTGIQVGVLAAALVVGWSWPLPVALATCVPLGFPLLLAQGALLYWLIRSR